MNDHAQPVASQHNLHVDIVHCDHQRQEQVFDQLSKSYSKEPHAIRPMLKEGAVRAANKRALFVDLDAYTEAGGTVMRDLFRGDNGGWFQGAGLLDRLVAEKLRKRSKTIRAEGWKWVEVAPDFSFGHTYGLRQLRGEVAALTDEEQSTSNSLQAEETICTSMTARRSAEMLVGQPPAFSCRANARREPFCVWIALTDGEKATLLEQCGSRSICAAHNPRSLNPGCSSGRQPSGQWYLR